MNKFLIAFLAAAAAIATAPSARADVISFQSTGQNTGTTATVTNGLTGSLSGTTSSAPIEISVDSKDDPLDDFQLKGTLTISAIPGGGGTGMVLGGTLLAGDYNGNPTSNAVDVEIVSDMADECGGIGHVCLTGIENAGTYSASSTGNKDGSFGGSFIVTYIAPSIAAQLGDYDILLDGGEAEDTFATNNNTITKNGANPPTYTASGTSYAAAIQELQIESIVPEPSSVVLMLTGFLGLGFLALRKMKGGNMVAQGFTPSV